MIARRYALLAALALLASPTLAWADAAPVLVVFELEDSRPKKARLPATKRRALTQLLRTQLAVQGRFQIVPTSELKAALRDQKKASLSACYDESCQIEIGRELAAEKSVASKLGVLGSRCILTASVFDLAKSTTEGAASHKGACDEDALVAGIEALARQLRGDGRASAGFARAVVDIGALDDVDVQVDLSGGAFARLDVGLLEKVQVATRLERSKGPVDVAARAGAWERVAKSGGEHPVKAQAALRAEYWRRVGALRRRFEADHAKLEKLRALDADVLSAAQKVAATQEFTEAYAPYRDALVAVGVKVPWPRLSDGRFCPYGATSRRGGENMEQCLVGGVREGAYLLRRRSETIQGYYERGDKSGLWITTGKTTRSECRFADGKKDGPCVEWQVADGVKLAKRNECVFRAGLRHGRCVRYREDGARVESTYVKDRLEGVSRQLDPRGHVGAVEPYQNGRLHGTVRRFYEDGSVSEETEYVHGNKHGPHWRYHRGGRPKLHGVYVKGQRHGAFVRTSPSGKVLTTMDFDMGTGQWIDVDDEGRARTLTRFVQGLRREQIKLWPGGAQRRRFSWDEGGAPSGTWSVWDADGNRCCEVRFAGARNGGPCTVLPQFEADGRRVARLTGERAEVCRPCEEVAEARRRWCSQAAR